MTKPFFSECIMDTIQMPAREITVSENADVVVAGGGPAGFAAAIAAARQGAKTLLVEAAGCLGGQATSGLVGPFMDTFGTEGIYTELLERMKKQNGILEERRFDAELCKLIMQEMLDESGAGLLLFTMTADVLQEDHQVKGLLIANKAGLTAVQADVIIDCTGDGDVAFYAGSAYEKGNKAGFLQASTLWLEVDGVDEQAYEAGRQKYREDLAANFNRERAAGRLNMPEHAKVRLIWKGSTIAPHRYSVNTDTAFNVDCTDPRALTQATCESRQRVFEVIEFFRKYLPGASECTVNKTGSIFGVRETRRFKGVESITGGDVVKGTKRTDGICRASFFLDLHDGDSHQGVKNRWGKDRPEKGDWYEIPYGCLVPEKTDGLLLAGRNISSDRDSNGSLRIMPTCMATGQAAGTAAAICAKEVIQPRDLKPEKLQPILKDRYSVTLAHHI